jgi:hypothetical protein
VAVAGIAAIPARRVVAGIAEVVIRLAFPGALDHHFRQQFEAPVSSI